MRAWGIPIGGVALLAGCEPGLAELRRAEDAVVPLEAERYYASACLAGSWEGCAGWRDELAKRGAPPEPAALVPLCADTPPDARACADLGRIAIAAGDREGAIAVFERACAAGGLACADLAWWIFPTEPGRARALVGSDVALKACEADVEAACLALAPGEAREWEERTVAECFQRLPGFERACDRLARLHADDPPDPGRPWSAAAFWWTHRAVCPDDTPACAAAEDAWFAPFAADVAPACARGDGPACVAHGLLLETGRGVPLDLAAAAAAFRVACDAGAVEGCWRYGRALQQGRGVATDRAAAVAWLDRACDAGSARGCAEGAEARLYGVGVRRDPRAARHLATRACDLGDGCERLGSMAAIAAPGPAGKDARRDIVAGGCTRGDLTACWNLWGRGDGDREAHGRLGVWTARLLESATVGCADWDERACRVLALMSEEIAHGPERMEALGRGGRIHVAEMATARSCDLGWAAGCLAGGRYEQACAMGLRDACEVASPRGAR